MLLENVVLDATDPARLGLFWRDLLGLEALTDEEQGTESRLTVAGGPVLDFCHPRVDDPAKAPSRLHLELSGDGSRDRQTDPEGHPFGVVEQPDAEGPPSLVRVRLESADPARDREFWRVATGWVPGDGPGMTLRHPSGRGPVLELSPESQPKTPGSKNPEHLDVRLEASDDPAAALDRLLGLGGSEPPHGWGSLPWHVLHDPSGNELCLLPASAH